MRKAWLIRPGYRAWGNYRSARTVAAGVPGPALAAGTAGRNAATAAG
jgi:hypothetical protein